MELTVMWFPSNLQMILGPWLHTISEVEMQSKHHSSDIGIYLRMNSFCVPFFSEIDLFI